MSSSSGEDDELLAELAASMAEAEDVPDWFVRDGQELFAWHDVDAELAALAEHTVETVGSRSEEREVTAVTFSTPGLVVELERAGAELVGQLVPPGPVTVDVRDRDGVRQQSVDELGFFRVDPAPSGPFRLEVTTGDGTVVVTPVTNL